MLVGEHYNILTKDILEYQYLYTHMKHIIILYISQG